MRNLLVRNPSSLKKFSPSEGTKSFVSFRNASFWEAMDKCFNTKATEKITGIEITENGITATFENQ